MEFRENVTNKGTLILAGKNAESNEKLIGQFIGKKNIIMHTAKPGSPFCVITNRPKIGDKKSTAIFCASRSQDWRDNNGDVIVHVFTGKDIYKRKGMETGTFGIKKFKKIKIKKIDIENLKK